MKLISGHFNLFPILKFASENPMMPAPDSSIQKTYRTIITKLIIDVPANKSGWYLWGKFNDTGWWETIYLGKAGHKKTSSLYTRLYDELREEFIAFWSYIFGREPMIRRYNVIYKNKYDPTKSLRKSGSQFVIWIGIDETISEEEISKQEEILIKIFRPTHNAVRFNDYSKHDLLTEEIEKKVEEELKLIRKGKQ